MKHVLYGDKSLLMGDEAADAISDYIALLIRHASADSVTVRAIGPDGNEVDVTLLLAAGVSLATESTNSDLEPPENGEVVARMTQRAAALRHPPEVQPEDVPPSASADDDRLWE